MFDDVDDEGNPTAFKETIRMFREPDSRRYLPKLAYLRVHVVETDMVADEETFYSFGDTQKIDLSKYVDLRDGQEPDEPEHVSFMFRPTQAQIAEDPSIPSIVKLDAEITVRITNDEKLTSDAKFNDLEEAKWEEEEVVKQHTMAVEKFKGPNPIIHACKSIPELANEKNPDLIITKLEQNKKLRMQVCK